jgi:gamma-glutamyltranspeptidase/glutathione hydrolase
MRSLDQAARRRGILARFFLGGLFVLLLPAGEGIPAGSVDAPDAHDIHIGDVVDASHGMVVTAHPQASAVGARLLLSGGNAVDAAVGAAFALAVVEPEASGLGGGGFLIVYSAASGTCASLDYRETAPRLCTPDMYAVHGGGMPGVWSPPADEREQLKLRQIGGSSIAVPRTVSGLLHAHAVHGRLPLPAVLEPAITLAEDGFTVSDTLYRAVLNAYDAILENDELAAVFLDDGLPYEPGATATRADLARTLRMLAEAGEDGFYRGELAEAIVAAVRTAGGILQLEDLSDVRVTFSSPIQSHYRDVWIATPPAPAGGLSVLEALRILEGYSLHENTMPEDLLIHLLAEAVKRSLADRARYVGDPEHVGVPMETLLGSAWCAARRSTIDPERADPSPEPGLMDAPNTTHISVVDADGNAVSLTQSINLFFGSRVIVPGWGILLNNTMADFDPEPGSANSIAPGKRSTSSMAPLLVFDDAGLSGVLGTPGGARIPSALVGILARWIDRGSSLSDAIRAPRFHPDGELLHVESRVEQDVAAALAVRGHTIVARAPFDLFFGGAHAIEVRWDNDAMQLIGVADPRRAGQAAGLP